MKQVIIIGGGASGMAAAVFAAEAGCRVTLYEKNEKLGKKVYITGKGRCNFTNVCPPEEFLANVVTNPKFLYSSAFRFSAADTMAFFERLGMKTKVERGRRAFPASDHASDVIKALERRMKELGVEIRLNTTVKKLPFPDENTAVIVATGGLSYPTTGSTGDGYRFAKETGHRVTDTRPALTSLLVKETFIPELEGLSLRNVRLSASPGKKKTYEDFGELVFTRKGISGPLALTASSKLGALLEKTDIPAFLDLKPALEPDTLDRRLLRELSADANKQYKNVIRTLLPASLVPVFVTISGIPGEKQANSITKEERRRIAELLKHFPLTLTGTGAYTEAVITQGGVNVRDVDPKTMESKKIPGLYFIGEVLDVDALTGGYNLQIAWSTAWAAVKGICGQGQPEIQQNNQ